MNQALSFIRGEMKLDDKDSESFLSNLLFSSRLSIESVENVSKLVPNEQIMKELVKLGAKRVCQYQFKKNDIVWICRECEADETCVLCNECFQGSNHQGHEVYFYHSNSGGCCDCGDSSAWKPEGFCHRHGRSHTDPLLIFPSDIRESADALLTTLIEGIITYWEDFHRYCISESTDHELDAKVDVIVINDDVHTSQEVLKNFQSIRIPTDMANRLIQEINDNGHASIRTSTYEDVISSVTELRGHGLLVAILPYDYRDREIAVMQSINWIKKLAATSDAMCRIICLKLSCSQLSRILSVDNFLPKKLSQPMHFLFLAVMADSTFKQNLAEAYAITYPIITSNYSKGIGTSDCNLFGLSVQFLNRDFYVTRMMEDYNFMRVVSKALYDCLSQSPSFDISAMSVVYRRYNPIVGDLKIIFCLPGMARCYISQCLPEFLKLLTSYQLMHKQTRQVHRHVDFEDSVWMQAFNLYINLSSLFDNLLNWFADPSSTISTEYIPSSHNSPYLTPSTVSASASMTSFMLYSGEDVANLSLRSLCLWHTAYHTLGMVSTRQIHSRYCFDFNQPMLCYAIQPDNYSSETYSVQQIISNCSQCVKNSIVYNIPNPIATDSNGEENSFHILLHRFYTSVLKELTYYSHHIETLRNHLLSYLSVATHNQMVSTDATSTIDANIAHIPIRVLHFAADIKLNKWVRNGRMMQDQLLNYQEVPFCKIFRSLDLLLIQTIVTATWMANKASPENNQVVTYPLIQHILKEIGQESEEGILETGLLEESILILVHMITELPAYPTETAAERHIPWIRRCFIHRLAQGACSYSQLLECCNFYTNNHKVGNKVMDDILDEIADKREGQALEPMKYILRRSYWSEYNQCYPYVSSRIHNAISEIRPKVLSNQPIVSSACYSKPHPLYAPIKQILLSDADMLYMIRTVFRSHMISNTKDENSIALFDGSFSIPINTTSSINSSIVTSDGHLSYSMLSKPMQEHILKHFSKLCHKQNVSYTGFLYTLQLFTMIIQNLCSSDTIESIQSVQAIDEEDRIALKLFERYEKVYEFLLQEEIIYYIIPIETTTTTTESKVSICRPSLLSILLAYYDELLSDTISSSSLSYDQTQQNNLKYWIGWILDMLSKMLTINYSTQCKLTQPETVAIGKISELRKQISNQITLHKNKNSNSLSKAPDRVAKQNKAREKAMSKLKKSAQAFAKTLDTIDTDTIAIGESSTNMIDENNKASSNTEENHRESEDNSNVCIICQNPSYTKDNPIGYLALSQSSHILCHRVYPTICRFGETNHIGSYQTLSNSNNNTSSSNSSSYTTFEQSQDLVIDSTLDNTTSSNQPTLSDSNRLYVSYCGHAMHMNCFDGFFAAVIDRSESQDGLIIDTTKGQFLCPLCKRLNNLLIPMVTSVNEITLSNNITVPNHITESTIENKATGMRNMLKQSIRWSRMPNEVFDKTVLHSFLLSRGLLQDIISDIYPHYSEIMYSYTFWRLSDGMLSISTDSNYNHWYLHPNTATAFTSTDGYNNSDSFTNSTSDIFSREVDAQNTKSNIFNSIRNTRHSSGSIVSRERRERNIVEESSLRRIFRNGIRGLFMGSDSNTNDNTNGNTDTTAGTNLRNRTVEEANNIDIPHNDPFESISSLISVNRQSQDNEDSSNDIASYELEKYKKEVIAIEQNLNIMEKILCIRFLINLCGPLLESDQRMSLGSSINKNVPYTIDSQITYLIETAINSIAYTLACNYLSNAVGKESDSSVITNESDVTQSTYNRMKYVKTFLDSVAYAMETFGINYLLRQSVCLSILGRNTYLCNRENSITQTNMKQNNIENSTENGKDIVAYKYLLNGKRPLLLKPIYEYSIATYAILKNSMTQENIITNDPMLDDPMLSYVQSLCIAYLVQLLLCGYDIHYSMLCDINPLLSSQLRLDLYEKLYPLPSASHNDSNNDNDSDNHNNNNNNSSGSNNNIPEIPENGIHFISSCAIYGFIEKISQVVSTYYSIARKQAYGENNTGIDKIDRIHPMPESLLRDILFNWIAYLGSMRYVVYSFNPLLNHNISAMLNYTILSHPNELTNEYIISTIKSIGLTELLSLSIISNIEKNSDHNLNSESSTNDNSNSLLCEYFLGLSHSWLSDLFTSIDFNILLATTTTSSFSSNPIPSYAMLNTNESIHYIRSIIRWNRIPMSSIPSLATLPMSYTQLHASISATYSYESPAICLSCGQILNCDKKGTCTKHAKLCSGETGVFFLVQDCTILLIYGDRACYAASPYIDDYGERHRAFRGLPLNLDKKRLALLQRMWLSHEIAREVTMKRSSSARVIILGHY